MITELTILDNDGNLFSQNGLRYVIPLYQRPFAWEYDQIERLIEDINDFKEDNYYLGTLMVFQNGNTYEVIDGQQRLTALFLLLSSLKLPIKNTLRFACREASNNALEHINDLSSTDKKIEQSIADGKRATEKILRVFDSKNLLSQLRKVRLYRVNVPEHTDLNRYFEIMNTRGEQLDQCDVLKAQLMKPLAQDDDRTLFTKIWNACSDMSGYVQMHFDKDTRSQLFGDGWNTLPNLNTIKHANSDTNNGFTIDDIIKANFKAIGKSDEDGVSDENEDEKERFESIISFPFFLLHTLKVLVRMVKIEHIEPDRTILYELLDDKKLIDAFERVIKYGKYKGKTIAGNEHSFSILFMTCLLKCRFLFDKYIIKKDYKGDSDGEWSLKELVAYGQGANRKANYNNKQFQIGQEQAKTYEQRNKINLMLQSCLRVSYTSPRNMHWITDLLHWLCVGANLSQNIGQYEVEIGKIAQNAVKKDYFNNKNYNLGLNTPHIVFNYLDYLIWYYNKEKYSDFVFEFRNSVEHWYPQNPSDNSFPRWNDRDGLDGLGNLYFFHVLYNQYCAILHVKKYSLPLFATLDFPLQSCLQMCSFLLLVLN